MAWKPIEFGCVSFHNCKKYDQDKSAATHETGEQLSTRVFCAQDIRPRSHESPIVEKDSKMIEENEAFKVVNGAFPHIGKAIQVFWGHREFHEYIDNLQQERKGVVRAGFPNNVMNALLELTSEHDANFPQLKPQIKDVWSIYADRR